MSTVPRVAVFGVGPSGLAVAQAVLRAGGNVTMFAKRREPSNLYGCQYLHAPIPGYEDVPKASVSYALAGSPEEYRRKVYGDSWDGRVSPEDFIGEHEAWDIRETYRRMWDTLIEKRRRWGSVSFVLADISPMWLHDHDQTLYERYAAIVSTIPATHLCREMGQGSHTFKSHMVFANGSIEAEENAAWPPDNSIHCDGTNEHTWYRYAKVFGHTTAEWAERPHRNAAVVEKPLSTDCNCFQYIIRMGRYGAWQKGVLVHDVYAQAEKLMQELL